MSKLLDSKTEELIALGVAYALNCQKCIKVHKEIARKSGLSLSEMKDALSIAEGVIKGANSVTKGAIVEIFGSEVEDNRCCPIGSECCP